MTLLLVLLFSATAANQEPALTLTDLPDSYIATVDNPADPYLANASLCMPGATVGQCSLRSALLLCADHLVLSTRTCTVLLPPASSLAVNTSQGDMALTASNAAGLLVMEGAGCRLAPLVGESAGTNGRLLRIEATEGNSLSFQLSNVTIENFENPFSIGGAVAIQKLSSGFMVDVTFLNNTGGSGGAVFVDKSPGFQFVRCSFEQNSAVNEGGGVLVDSSCSGVSFDSCLFERNCAELGLGGGLFIRDNNNDVSINRCNFTHNYGVRG
jgi:hypothetical protein